MNGFRGSWIWTGEEDLGENKVVRFHKEVTLKDPRDVEIRISADTRYVLSVNGEEVGRGPIRSTLARWFFDTYSLDGYLKDGTNLLEFRVWDYGWSTYQTIAHRGGLIFDLLQGGEVIACSDHTVLCAREKAFRSRTVKRNVNLGFMECYDARQDMGLEWQFACPVTDSWGTLHQRPVLHMDKQKVRPEEISWIRSVQPRRQCVSVNTRTTFFPGRRDANATIMTGYIGVALYASRNMEGIIAFPNTKWNGMHGNFKIENVLYTVPKTEREIHVSIREGVQLFLMELASKFDDLYVHMEFEFDEPLRFGHFFVIGPTGQIENETDGFTKIYGGLEDFCVYVDSDQAHREIFQHATLEGIRKYGDQIRTVPYEYVFHNEYVLSLVRNPRVLETFPVCSEHNRFLHGNTSRTVLRKPAAGDLEIVVDFHDYHVGSLCFRLKAASGTILDLYGFENLFENQIDFTTGLNNAIRYICKEGYQEYHTLTRLGFRYLMLVFRNITSDIHVEEVATIQASYPASRNGNFRCSDYLLNKIFEISRRTNLLCSEDTFVDSPAYEQVYWTGDAQVSALVSTYCFGEYGLVRHCVNQAPLSRPYSPLLNALMPTDWKTAIPLWTMNWMITADQYLFHSGDAGFIREIYPEIRETLRYYARFIREDGGFHISAWNMVDWAPMDIYNEGIMTAQQGVLAHCMSIARRMAESLGETEDLNFYDNHAEKLLKYLDQTLWLENQQAFSDGWTRERGYSRTLSIQTHLMLYKYDCIRCSRKREIVKQHLLTPPAGWLEIGSPFMLFYLFEIWHDQGRNQKILDAIRDKWGMMLRYDSSTCWEVFPGYFENSRTRSYCHSWSSAPAYVMIRYLLGLEPVEPGFSKLRLLVPDVDLAWCEGSIPTPRGKITVWWSSENGKKRFRAEIPKDMEVDISLAGEWDVSIGRI